MFSVTDAALLAIEAHEGQVDKAGIPYIRHPERVALAVWKAGGTEEQEMAAWLHDAVEDTDATYRSLNDAGVPWDVLVIVKALTHLQGEPNVDYWKRIKARPPAVLVKLCDIHDNLTPARMFYLDSKTQNRLRIKYGNALIALSS
jgi:(p)ppGpp synthase/HD superfamily hydrolase